MSDTFSIQLHNKKHFEQGEPGVWLKLPATAEQLHAAMQQVGITADNTQDFFINGIDTQIEAVTRLTLENIQSAGVDELNYLAACLEQLDPAQIAKLDAAGDGLAYWNDVHHLTEYTHNTDFFVHIPDVFNHIQLGEYYLEKTDMIQMPEEWIGAINIEMLGQLAAEHEKGIFTDKGYILESGDEWKPVVEIPLQYHIMSFPQQEQGSQNLDYDTAPTPAAIVTNAPELQREPQPVIPIVLDSEKPADKLKEITDKLENGITDIFNSEQYQDYLKTLSKFHNYSLNNTILIAMQKPDASHVAGFNTWKNEFERNVRKGEKGIKIIAPSPFKVKKEMEKIDPNTQRPVMGADGKPVTEQVEVKIPAFKVVSVFDVSQTEGKELPTIGADILTGDVEQYKDFFAALEKTSPVAIAFENIEGGVKGYYHQVDKRIAIHEGMSELQTLKTAIHEIAHARLHDIDRNAEQDEQQPRADRRTREVEAESVAYTVCQHYGLDTSDYSFGYVAGWSSGKELTELKVSLETIRATAAQLITEIDGHFAELQQDKEQTAEQRPVFENLPPEQQQALSNEVQATLQFFIDSDMQSHGEVTDSTLEAIAVQGYVYSNGKLEKADQPEQQTGFEKWSEPTTIENTPDNPGIPSDDTNAYLPQQDEQPSQPDDKGQSSTEQDTAVKYYAINESAARRAKEMNSYYDYKPGSATAEYRQSVDEIVDIAERHKKRVDPMYHEKIDRLVDTYARKLAENMNNSFSIESRVPSIMIAGASNFPVRQKEKQNNARRSNMDEWRYIQGLRDKILSTGMGGISADDPNATKKLQEKLTGLEKSQETMKAANAYYRKHKTLDGCPVLSAESIQKLTADMANRWYGRVATKPFEAYSLQNNNAEINRIKGRITELTRRSEATYTGWQFDGGKVEANQQDNRLQIFFEEKPDEETRKELKSNGFRWAPSAGAWQRQLNNNAFYAANGIKSIQPLTGERPTELQRKVQQEAVQPMEQEQSEPPKQGDTFSIYQLKQDDSTRDIRFEPLDRLQATGHVIEPGNYELVYTALITEETANLENIFYKFNIDHPDDYTGRSLSVSDIVTLNHDGEETAHYVDSFGFQEVPEFLQQQTFDLYKTTDYLQTIHNNVMLADADKTMGVATFNITIKRLDKLSGEIPETQTALKMLVDHAVGSTDLSMLQERMASIMQQINPIATAEMSEEQNYNMIDGIPNNRPTVDKLEKQVKAGQTISLVDLANAIKSDKTVERNTGEKPSIKEQLKAGKEQCQKEKSTPDKTRHKAPDLEV